MKEINGFKDFSEYILELNKTKRDCPHLIVLPEDVLYKEKLEDVEYKERYLNEPMVFLKGSLLCRVLAFCSKGKGPRCSTGKSEITLNENGELETLCGYGGNSLVIEVKRFKPYVEKSL